MSRNSAIPKRNGDAYWVATVLVAAALVLAVRPFRFASPVKPAVRVPAWVTDPTPVRPTSMRPAYRVGTFTFRCTECHRSLPAPYTAGLGLTNHADIHMAHGINRRCLNCHHPANRDTFVDDYGHEIPWAQPQLLCAKCHGPVYRDWQHGVHGRSNGYWDRTRGEQTRLKCVECHDPHRPPFPPMHAAPGPNTLRMGPQEFRDHHQDRDPLHVLLSEHGRPVEGTRKGD